MDVQITTTDVIHSFWAPRLAGKLDAIPGHVNVLRIEADTPGDYAGVSAEFSGPGYTAPASPCGRMTRPPGTPSSAERLNECPGRHRELERIWASRPGWRGKLTTVNNNDIGADVPGPCGDVLRHRGILAMMIRAQLATRARSSWDLRSTTRSSRCTGPS